MLEADLARVYEIEQQTYPFPWTKGVLHSCFRPDYFCQVLEIDKVIQGYIIMSLVPAVGEAHILNVCVHPRGQGHGLGRLLMNEGFKAAQQQALQTIFLEVRASNSVAISLYDSLGFNEIGVRKNYYPADKGHEDAVVMAYYLGFG